MQNLKLMTASTGATFLWATAAIGTGAPVAFVSVTGVLLLALTGGLSALLAEGA